MGGSEVEVWEKLPSIAKVRFSAIIKHFWVKFVPKDNRNNGLSTAALGKLFKTMGEDVSEDGNNCFVRRFNWHFLSGSTPFNLSCDFTDDLQTTAITISASIFIVCLIYLLVAFSFHCILQCSLESSSSLIRTGTAWWT